MCPSILHSSAGCSPTALLINWLLLLLLLLWECWAQGCLGCLHPACQHRGFAPHVKELAPTSDLPQPTRTTKCRVCVRLGMGLAGPGQGERYKGWLGSSKWPLAAR